MLPARNAESLPHSCPDICLGSAPGPHGAVLRWRLSPGLPGALSSDSPACSGSHSLITQRGGSSEACDAKLPWRSQLIHSLRGSIV